MPEPLSTSASIAGLCNLSIEVAKLTYSYVDSVKSAPKEVTALASQANALGEVLGKLQSILQDENGQENTFCQPNSGLGLALRQCDREVWKLCEKLKGLQSSGSSGPAMHQKLIWPFKKQECIKVTKYLFDCSQTFQFCLTLTNRQQMTKDHEDLRKSLQGQQEKLAAVASMMSTVPSEITDLSQQVESALSIIAQCAECCNRLSSQIQTLQEATESNEKEALLQSIPSLEPYKQHCDIRDRRLEGTSRWILEDQKFLGWRFGSESSRILYCFGDPGAGKTIVTSLIIDELLDEARNASSDQKLGLAYLYCDYRYRAQQTTAKLLGTILRSLLAALPHVPDEVTSIYRRCLKEGRSFEFEDVKESLLSVWKKFSRVNICIDALDELQSVNPLLQWLSQVPEPVKLLLTSRKHVENAVECFMGEVPRIQVTARKDDVKALIKKRIDEGRLRDPDIMNSDLENVIVDKIMNLSRGMFLLPALHIRVVLEARTISKRRSALGSLSTELHETFDSTIARVKEQAKSSAKQAMRILSLVFLAETPLSVDVLLHALATEPGQQDLDRDNFPSRRTFLECCLGLVIIDNETSTVRLVHYALQEYFVRTQGQLFACGDDDIAQTCLTYLLFSTLTNRLSVPYRIVEADRNREAWVSEFPFLKYAACQWGNHARKAYPLKDHTTCLARKYLCSNERSLVHSASFFYIDTISCFGWRYIPDITALHIASAFGIPQVLDLDMLRHQLDAVDSIGRTPLSVAAEYGRREAVDLLIEEGSRIEPADLERNPRTMKFLLIPTPWVMMRSAKFFYDTTRRVMTPLLDAVRSGHEQVFISLIDKGASVHVTDNVQRTALSHAAEMGQLGIVQLLIDKGAELDKVDFYERTALWYAVDSDRIDVAYLLIKNGADVNGGYRPNIMAISNSLQRAQEADSGGVGCQNNQRAQVLRTEAKTQCMMEPRPSVTSSDLGDGRKKINIQELIPRGADVPITETTVRLARGTSIDSEWVKKRTPLLSAAEAGNASMVKLLIDEGANIDYVRHTGWMARRRDKKESYEKIESLLGQAPDIDESMNHFFL